MSAAGYQPSQPAPPKDGKLVVAMNAPSLPTLNMIMNAAARTITPFRENEKVEVRRLGAAYLKRLKKLGIVAKSGKRGQRRARQHELLHAPGAKVVALLLSYPKCGSGRPMITLKAVKKLAREVNMFQPSGELVRVRFLEKSNGGKRPIASFGRRTRAGQRLALDVMRATWGDSEFEFARTGRGREAAVREILSGVQHRRARWIGSADVKGYFPSIRRKAVLRSGLLPVNVIQHYILMAGSELDLPYGISGSQRKSLRDGLWQGAIPSAYVASKLIENELSSLRRRLGLCYVDNVFIGEATKAAAEVRLDTLASSLAKHPAGGFQLTDRTVTRVGGDHDLLGYRVSWTSPFYGGGARAKPSRKAICRRERKLLARLIPTESGSFDAATNIWSQAWPPQFPLWETKKQAAEISELIATCEIWPLARMLRRAIVASRVSFSSFQQLGRLCTSLARVRKPEVDWADLENARFSGNKAVAACLLAPSTILTHAKLVNMVRQLRRTI